MKEKYTYATVVLAMFFALSAQLNAQDLHYSQFYNSPQNINPALTGVFNGDHRIMISMRDQWRFVPVPWFTLSGAYDRKYYVLKGQNQFLGAGLSINNDRQGDSKLNLTSINLNGAYHRILNDHNIISGGITLGFASRGFNSTLLTWDKQWDGEIFNANLPTGESFSNMERVNFLETGLGLNYRYQRDSRTYADIGTSALHLLKPNSAFYNKDVADLPQRITFSGVGQIRLTKILDLQLHILHQLQGKYNETIFGGLGKIYLSEKRGKEIQLHAGIGYRTAQSLIPIMAIQYNNIYAGLSYDVDSNNFNDIVNSNKGGPEIHVRYIIANVKPIKEAKVCPVY
ncbi:MAG: PorP/SprF family type IX secretion system membrane protein [Saprospiraceae bacterium]|nr:PorP/SprF family type IX secretion system membrane protein [Saprospiraceae bacterium]